jgi:hypothetical protein
MGREPATEAIPEASYSHHNHMSQRHPWRAPQICREVWFWEGVDKECRTVANRMMNQTLLGRGWDCLLFIPLWE